LVDILGHSVPTGARLPHSKISPRSCLGLVPVNERPLSAKIQPWYSATSALWCLLVHYQLPASDRHVRRCHRHGQCCSIEISQRLGRFFACSSDRKNFPL
jgi:hypothetical protein